MFGLREFHSDRRKAKIPHVPTLHHEIRRLRLLGWTHNRISDSLGFSVSAIRMACDGLPAFVGEGYPYRPNYPLVDSKPLSHKAAVDAVWFMLPVAFGNQLSALLRPGAVDEIAEIHRLWNIVCMAMYLGLPPNQISDIWSDYMVAQICFVHRMVPYDECVIKGFLSALNAEKEILSLVPGLNNYCAGFTPDQRAANNKPSKRAELSAENMLYLKKIARQAISAARRYLPEWAAVDIQYEDLVQEAYLMYLSGEAVDRSDLGLKKAIGHCLKKAKGAKVPTSLARPAVPDDPGSDSILDVYFSND